jgi:hypothetical protein
MVAAKMANKCQAFSATPFGAGMNHMINATTNVIATFLIFISFMILTI